jgi:CubicO group peptidase (beta-lactamase class C family)
MLLPGAIGGTVAPGFEGVRDAFAANFADRGEIGAALCVHVDQRRVVDLWGGVADRATGRLWGPDTPIVVFSCTKGLVATCFLMLEDRGGIDLDAPVVRYWPEFAAVGHEALTVRTLLNHRSGLCAVDRPLRLADLSDVPRLESALVAQVPLWEPGADQGYGASAFGMYAQAVFRRAAGRTLGRYLADEIVQPLGVDAWLGLPEAVRPRLATLYPVGGWEGLCSVGAHLARDSLEGRMYRGVLSRRSPCARAVGNPRDLGARHFAAYQLWAAQRIEMPWANAHVSARALSRIYDPLANGGATRDGVRLVSRPALDAVHARQSWVQRDRVLHKPLGHSGVGGALGFADPAARVSFGYVMNRMAAHVRSPRTLALCHAVYRCLGTSP